MKQLVLSLLLLCCSPLYAGQLTSFDEVRESILNGNNIKLVIDFNACIPQISDLIIYTVPHDIALHKDYLEFADMPYITDAPSSTGTSVDFENVTYKLTETGELSFQFKSIMLSGQDVSVHESGANCPLTTAVKIFN